MPLLLYGSIGLNEERKLYTAGMRPIEEGVFERYMIDGLAPWSKRVAIANYWWIRSTKKVHSCFAWYDARKIEQAVFIPGQHHWRDALIIAREEFKHFMPSAIIFRVNNQGWVYTYDG